MTKPVNILKAYIDPETGIVYADEGRSSSIAPIGFVVSSGTNIGGALVHGSLYGLDVDDHLQYVLVDGSRPFTAIPTTTTTGIPNSPGDLITKDFLDSFVSASGLAGVASLNTQTGNLTLVGSGLADVTTVGSDIFISVSGSITSNDALVGEGNVTVTSGINQITISGSTSLGSITKTSSLPLSPEEGDVVFLTTSKQFLGYTGSEWVILG